jgi:hypothetical protein
MEVVMRFMNRFLSAILAASSLVFALPVRADDPSPVAKGDERAEHVLVARERIDSREAWMREQAQRSQVQSENFTSADDQAVSHAKSGTKSNLDDAFSDPILSNGP